MNCFPCFSSQKSKKSASKRDNASNDDNVNESRPPEPVRQRPQNSENHNVANNHTENGGNTASVKTFTFRDLATATKNFRQECLLGEGGFGRVYKGTLQSTGQMLAVKQLDKHGLHANKEFQVEVVALCQLEHPNLVKLIGYCADGDQRLLVYEFVSGRSLEDHLLDMKPIQQLMDWTTRMKIAYGAAQGLEYLHEKVDPPIIYRDLKASNILLDGELSPKLSDFGLHKLGPGTGDKMPLPSRVMDTYGYCAPEYSRGGNPTIKSDVYSFGVVLLELITGRRAVDTTKPSDEQNLVSWAQTFFKDPKRYPDMADPRLKKKFPERGLNQAVAIASMCLQEEAAARPLISDVMVALSFLSISTEDGIPTAVPILSFRDKSMSIALSRHASCSTTPSFAPESEKERQSISLDEKGYVNKDKKGEERDEDDDEGSSSGSDDGSGSESDENQEDKEEEASSGKSSSDSESDVDKKDKKEEAYNFGMSGKSNLDSTSNGDQEDKREESSHFGKNEKSNFESIKSGKSNFDSESDIDQEHKGEEASYFGIKSGKSNFDFDESDSDQEHNGEEVSHFGIKSGKSNFGSRKSGKSNFDSKSNGDQEHKEEEASHFGIKSGKSDFGSRKNGKSNFDFEFDGDQERKEEEASYFGKSGKYLKFDSKSESEFESESDGDREDKEEEASDLGKGERSDIILSFGSERRSADNKIIASSLKTNSSTSSEEEIESLSRKESQKSNEESTSSRYGNGKVESLRNVSGQTTSQVLRDDKSKKMGYSRGSKHDDQSVSSDDSDNDNNGFLCSKKSEGHDFL